MASALSFILPVFFPSWRFFQSVEPSPRVQWAVFPEGHAAPLEWQDFRPQPSTISLRQMILRLFWNPERNEDLYVISCAERIREHPTPHSIAEITRRIRDDLEEMPIAPAGQFLQFRLVFVHREAAQLVQEVVFVSNPVPAQTRPK